MDPSSSTAHSPISTYHTHLPSPLPSSPSFILHLTRFRDTLFIWMGTGPPTDGSGSIGGGGLDEDAAVAVGEKRLASDWAVAMPARGSIPVTATSVFRSSATDMALPMAQRLARRFPPNQIHLSLSLPPSLTHSTPGTSLDPFASKVLLVMEKKLGEWLGEVLRNEKSE